VINALSVAVSLLIRLASRFFAAIYHWKGQ
jgi:hypothetical protein